MYLLSPPNLAGEGTSGPIARNCWQDGRGDQGLEGAQRGIPLVGRGARASGTGPIVTAHARRAAADRHRAVGDLRARRVLRRELGLGRSGWRRARASSPLRRHRLQSSARSPPGTSAQRSRARWSIDAAPRWSSSRGRRGLVGAGRAAAISKLIGRSRLQAVPAPVEAAHGGCSRRPAGPDGRALRRMAARSPGHRAGTPATKQPRLDSLTDASSRSSTDVQDFSSVVPHTVTTLAPVASARGTFDPLLFFGDLELVMTSGRGAAAVKVS